MGGKSSSSSSASTTQTTTSSQDTQQIVKDYSSFFGQSGVHMGNTGQSITSTPYNAQNPSQSSTTTQRNDAQATGASVSLPGISGGLGEVAGGVVDTLGSAASGALGLYGAYQSTKNLSSGAGLGSYGSTSGSYDYYSSSSSGSSFVLPLIVGAIALIFIFFSGDKGK